MRRTALITGGSRGLGRALAEGLAAEGWNVVVDGRDPEALERARAAIDAAGPGTVVALPGDVDDPVHVAALVAAAIGQGRYELLVNNAGTLGPAPMPPVAELHAGDLERALRTNVVAPLRIIQASLPRLRSEHGAVVNITSDAAVEGYEGWGAYGATKAALEQLSRVLAAEEPAVGVYWVDPGDMHTRMHQDAFPGEDISDRPLPATRVPGLLRLVRERPPSGRYQVEQLLAPEADHAGGADEADATDAVPASGEAVALR
jgi:NAD(P)-dependent dehydrogenase (short-subunit alcohol dehydrogenase family)